MDDLINALETSDVYSIEQTDGKTYAIKLKAGTIGPQNPLATIDVCKRAVTMNEENTPLWDYLQAYRHADSTSKMEFEKSFQNYNLKHKALA